MVKKIILILLFITSFCTCIRGENELIITAKADKTNLSLDEKLVLEITISGEDATKVPDPAWPDLTDKFNLISQAESTSFSWINGNVSSAKTKRLILVPINTGVYIIDSFIINYKGETFKTKPIKIKVAPKSEETTSIPQKIPPIVPIQKPIQTEENKRYDIYLKSNVDKEEVYIGEQIIYSLKLYRRIHIWSNISMEQPNFQGFWTEDIKPEGETIKTIGNQRYYVFELIRKTLIPLTAEDILIHPAKVGFVINPFDGQRILETEPINISVLELPPDKPEHFSGAIGEFEISTEVDKINIKQNAPLIVKVKITGKGNLKSIQTLNFDQTKKFKIYKSKIDHEITDALKGKSNRIFEYIVIPQSTGKLTIPAFSLNYFSPTLQEFKNAFSNRININVKPEDIELTAVERDKKMKHKSIEYMTDKQILYLKEITALNKKRKPLALNTSLIIIVILNLIAAFFSIYIKIKQKVLFADPIKQKKNQANKLAIRKIKKLEKEIINKSQKLSQINNYILEYLTNKTGLSFQKLTSIEIKKQLILFGLKKEISSDLIKIIDKIAFAAYAPGMSDKIGLQNQINEVLTLIKKLEKDFKK